MTNILRPLIPRRFGFGGLTVAVIAFWLSLTPSLLPRGWVFQGVISGASAAIGYGMGVLASILLRYLVGREIPRRGRRAAWTTLAVAGVLGTIAMMVWFGIWQAELRDLMGSESFPAVGYPLVVVVAPIGFVVLVGIGRGVVRVTRWLAAGLRRFVPDRISVFVAAALVAILAVGTLNGVVTRVVMSGLNDSFAAINDETDADTVAPTNSNRSGGPGSLISWDSLGRQGRIFVSNASSTAELSTFNGVAATDPIRAYAGLASADGYRPEAELAADELERAGGLQRSVIAVGTTTGTGWINESTARSLEYLYNGDTAIVSMQYSYLPSPISFLVDQERARAAGHELFEAVYAKWSQLPENSRPKLVVFGESLGSFGGESAFAGIADLAARADGALFIGPTYTNDVWLQATDDRDPGSPQWLPIYRDGRNARFVSEASDLNRPGTPWPGPRIVYLQHPSDPITWWSPKLAVAKPDWLRETRGRDVLDSVRWIPLVTFLQVSADMADSNSVPDGHGHTFHADIANSWAAILGPPGWTPDNTRRLRQVLTDRQAEDAD